MTRETMTQAVNLAICINRGYYLGTVADKKARELDELKIYMTTQDEHEFNERIK